MPASRALLLAALGAVLLAASPGARATTVVRQSVESLVDQSELVVSGRVERVELRAGRSTRPFRLAYVRVAEGVGGAPALVPVRLPGGVDLAGRSCAVAGAPDLVEGQEVLLFLSRVPEAATTPPTEAPPGRGRRGERPAGGPQPARQWQPVALSLGTWPIVEEAGVPMATRDPAAAGLHQVGESAGSELPSKASVRSLLDRARGRKAAR